jgi:hypothetical protein
MTKKPLFELQGPGLGEPCPQTVRDALDEEDDEPPCGCRGKGWEVLNQDPDAGELGKIRRCHCEFLPDDETAYDAASADGLLVDVDGHVLPNPWGVYAAQVRRQRQAEALRRRLASAGKLLGTCSPHIHFYALGTNVFCDKSLVRVEYSATLEEFEALIARDELPGFRPV